jgi:hypothetical protein
MRTSRRAELYDAWMLAAAESTLALTSWRSAPRGEKRGAYEAYVATLDREADAAWLLQAGVAIAA